MMRFALLALVPVYMLLATPLQASGGAVVPEPSDFALFVLGVLGVIIGREGAVRYKRRERERDKKL